MDYKRNVDENFFSSHRLWFCLWSSQFTSWFKYRQSRIGESFQLADMCGCASFTKQGENCYAIQLLGNNTSHSIAKVQMCSFIVHIHNENACYYLLWVKFGCIFQANWRFAVAHVHNVNAIGTRENSFENSAFHWKFTPMPFDYDIDRHC